MRTEQESEKLRDEFIKLSDPLIKFLNDNSNPHAKIIIDPMGAEMVTGEIGYSTESHLRDWYG